MTTAQLLAWVRYGLEVLLDRFLIAVGAAALITIAPYVIRGFCVLIVLGHEGLLGLESFLTAAGVSAQQLGGGGL